MISDTGADIRDDRAFLEVQRGQHPVRLFLLNPLGPDQPIRSGASHHRGGLAPGLRVSEGQTEEQDYWNCPKFPHERQC